MLLCKSCTGTRGVVTGCTAVDMSTPLLAEVVPEIDANPLSFYWGGERVGQVWSLTRQSLSYVNFNDNAARDDAAGDDNTVLYLQFFDTDVPQIPGV